VDGDGFDEIIYGSMTVDHDGTGLYTTRMGHGDAIHLTDFIPERPGLEVLDVHENKVDGTTLRDAKTGEVIYQIKSTDDVGRGMGTDIDPNSRGMEWWSSRSGGVRSSEDGRVLTNAGVSMNMAAWWDGDLLRELQDGPYVTKYNYQNNNMITLLNASAEAASNNGSKANPSLVADVIGDWREEVILRTNDNKFVRIYMTTYPTDYRFHTFLEDPVYRMSVVYQNVAYNQPTHTGFYFGADLENIFPEKNILIEENTYTVNPIFNAIDYQWSTGETTKEIVLNRFDYEQDVKNEISLEMNFRGHTFKDTLAFTFIAPTGTVKLLSDNEIRLLNNPVNEYLRLFFNITGKFDIQIISLTGQIAGNFTVDASAGEVQTFDIANLNQGMYLLNISNDKQKRTIRFVKNN
jgi:rhamnogalacturonan endolyase